MGTLDPNISTYATSIHGESFSLGKIKTTRTPFVGRDKDIYMHFPHKMGGRNLPQWPED